MKVEYYLYVENSQTMLKKAPKQGILRELADKLDIDTEIYQNYGDMCVWTSREGSM